ncbi:MAG TPA: polysaccharide biosynthesis/export family protein [Terracidiphilus sp.]|nr:polysaccharide biosynthesis/export family protein [Terracidiphilus sp.]
MRIIRIVLFTLSATCLCVAQQTPVGELNNQSSAALNQLANLPIEKIGVDDLVGISVYDSQELTRTVRVNVEGDIRLPMLKLPIHAAGLYPDGLEKSITAALIAENILVDPIVAVTVVEYQSRPITVAGEVKTPLTFQATGTVTLLDAISRGGGLSDNAGSDVIVTRQDPGADGKAALVQRIPLKELLEGGDPALNLVLKGGEEIRIPEADRVFVLGNVKKAGAFYLTDGPESSVLKALALSEGLDTFSSSTAYIYRKEGAAGGRKEIPIRLHEIMKRKSPDVALMADDILYIPTKSGTKATLSVLEASAGIAAAMGSAAVYYGTR